MKINGRVAVVTGGARGIGAAVVKRLCEEGVTTIAADVDGEPLAEVVEQVNAAGGRALAHTCDVTDRASVRALFEYASSTAGTVDHLVTCAGVLRFNPIGDITDDEWDLVVNASLRGTFLCTQAAAAIMASKASGRMVLISSGAARGFPKRAHYSAAKAGVQALAGTLMHELGPSNITVNVIAPGLIETRMPRAHAEYNGIDYDTFRERIVQATPLRRTGTPEDIAGVVAFLCSDDAAFVTGQVIDVSGGA